MKRTYIALGGVLMLIGMMTATIITPNLVAQKNADTFGNITCTELEIVDENGQTGIRLYTRKHIPRGIVWVYDESGTQAIGLGVTNDGGAIDVCDKSGEIAVRLGVTEDGGTVQAYDQAEWPLAVLSAAENGNAGTVTVYDKSGTILAGIGGNKDSNGGQMSIFDEARKVLASLP